MKLLVTLLLFTISLLARENPFFPLEGEEDFKTTTNVIEKFNTLNVQEIHLPDSARVLKKVTLTYQNLDGSIVVTEKKLNNSLDWHLPIQITQVTNNVSSSTPKKSTKKVDNVRKKKKVKTSGRFHKVYSYKFINFYQSTRFMQVASKDTLIRKFMVVNPHRIVMDFKRDALFLSKRKKLDSSYFKEVRLGNHDGYYRVVLELDGKYKYKIHTKKYGYLIELY